jgi:excisionase family DNA binding protein
MSDRIEAAIRELTDALREELGAQSSAGPDRLLSVDEAAATLGLGRSRLYEDLLAGRLRSVKVGRRRLIPATAVRQYIEAA